MEKADLVILNKLDLAPAALAEEVRDEVLDLNEASLVRYAERCDIDLLELLDGPTSGALARYAGGALPTPDDHEGHDDHDDHGHHDHSHDHGALHAPADSFVLDVPEPVDHATLTAFFKSAPEGLWRAKGFVRMGEADMLVQFAMGELEITAAPSRDRHYLVFIGDGLDSDRFADRLAAVRVREGAA